MAALAFVSLAMQAAGSVMAGNAQQTASNFQAKQYDQQATQVVAAAQRDMIEERRNADLLASRALALAAAGGGASDPTVVNLIADIENEGAYRASMALYRGQDEARKLNLAADASEYEGEVSRKTGALGALQSGLRGGASMYGKYGPPPPSGQRGALGLSDGVSVYN